MPFVKLENINCYYEIRGKGKPLILIAGLGSDSQSWHPAITELCKHFKIITFDNRGCGQTKSDHQDFTISDLAEDTISLIDRLKINKPYILGHSMGGYIAQQIAIAQPKKIAKLILASISSFTSERNKFLFVNMVRSLQNGIKYKSFLREFFCWIFTPQYFKNRKNIDSTLRYLLEYPYPVTLPGFKQQVKALNSFSSSNKLDRLKTETSILYGKEDILVTRKEIEEFTAKLANAKLIVLDSAAHSIHVEAPKAFVKQIIDFLQ